MYKMQSNFIISVVIILSLSNTFITSPVQSDCQTSLIECSDISIACANHCTADWLDELFNKSNVKHIVSYF